MLQPVALDGGRMAVIEVFVPAADVSRGVAASWAVLTAVAVVLIGVSVVVADRLATRVTRPARELALAAVALGDGDLNARSTGRGPAELAAAGHAFNAMAERVSRLIAAEREMAADLSHRLRTPLTALRLNAAALGPGRAADDTRLAIDRLEREVDLIIRAARRPAPDEPSRCDAAEVITERFGFWSALAEDQARPCLLSGAEEAATVPLPRSISRPRQTPCSATSSSTRPRARGSRSRCTAAKAPCSCSSPTRGRESPTRTRRCGAAAAGRAPPGSGWTSSAASPSPPAAA